MKRLSSPIYEENSMDRERLINFFNACNNARTLNLGNPIDQQYYIDFSSVRGGEIIQELDRTITFSDGTICQLFTGHLGCGKSTELLRLKMLLEKQGFHVVYFDIVSDGLDMSNVELSDILLAIARHVGESLDAVNISLKPGYFANLFADIADVLQTPIDLTVKTELAIGIAKITAQTKDNPRLRDRLRDFLEPRTRNLLEAINQDLIEIANRKLQEQGNRGLVVIVDGLERLDPRPMPSGSSQPEYLFIERGAQLSRLHCHVVYTIPLTLTFSQHFEELVNRLGTPKLLPMVPIKMRDGSTCHQGMALLQQMVLVRAFPELPPLQRLEKTTEIFDEVDTLIRLCNASGGHVRNLLFLLFNCLQQENPPISRSTLEYTIAQKQGQLRLAIREPDWVLLRQVAQQKWLSMTEPEHQALLRTLRMFEYRDTQGSWFDVNPILAEAPEMCI
jgi:energy-coupling factor transporter ATP-binding protein EcfA2